MTPRRALAGLLVPALSVVLAAGALLGAAGPAAAASYVPISGAGSTWSQNALDQWRRNVNQFGMRINYQGTGSSDGRNQFRNGTVDYAVSEIPYGLSDGGVVDAPPQRKFAYMPIVAGGTSFMYNLKIAGKRVTDLRLSGPVIAGLFTGQITSWDDPRVKADNPGLALPRRRVVPVVRSDGSGTTAQFSTWLSSRYAGPWDAWCAKAGRSTPCGVTSNYPVVPGRGFVAQSGSLGVSGYVAQAQSEGAITYVEYSYALNSGFPTAKVLNDAGYYTQPTAQNVAVALLAALINNDPSSPRYLTQQLGGVYANRDPRTYPLSSYSYMIIPTTAEGTFNQSKGKTLGDFAYYFLCEGQQQTPVLGFSPLPVNLVRAGLDQVRRIPGVDAKTIDIRSCHNPTFSSDGTNTLAKNAPPPPACDKQGPQQCGTAGAAGPVGSTTTGSRSNGAGASPAAGRTSSAAAGPTGAGAGNRGAAGGSAGSTAAGPGPGSAAGATGSGPVAVPTGGAPAVPGPSTVDPDTGQATTAAAAGGATTGEVAAVPVTLSARSTGGAGGGLMALAALVLVAVTVVPPLVSRRLRDAR